MADSAQNWGVVYQFCEHSLFHPHLTLPQGGMCWQEISLYICVFPWSLVLGLRGVLSLEYFASNLFSLSVFKDRCSIPFSYWILGDVDSLMSYLQTSEVRPSSL